jgi:predicted nucleotidyltransferase
MIATHVVFPTTLHQEVSEHLTAFFKTQPKVDAVLLVNSCARGKATPESDVDVAVLVSPTLGKEEKAVLEQDWLQYYRGEVVFEKLRQLGRFTNVHLDLIDGEYTSHVWDDGGGPDSFELELGNQIAYSVPLWQANDVFEALRAKWLPFYDEALRQQRLSMVREACLYDLEHVAFYVKRALYFQAFDRLYKAFQEFLQALCIARRTYPIAYNKWIHELVVEKLGLPDLYPQLPRLLEISKLESTEVVHKAELLRGLLEAWVTP